MFFADGKGPDVVLQSQGMRSFEHQKRRFVVVSE